MTSSLPKMRSCPFDGGMGELQEIENITVGFGFSFYRVVCSTCGGSGPVSEAAIGKRQRDAIEKWNERD